MERAGDILERRQDGLKTRGRGSADAQETVEERGGQVTAAERLEALRKSLDDAWDHSTELEDQIADGAEVELDRASVREIRGFVVAALGRVRR
jgi:hypothetical protein